MTSPESPLTTDLYELNMVQAYLDRGEDKEAVFDAADTAEVSVAVMAGVVAGLGLKVEPMRRAASVPEMMAAGLAVESWRPPGDVPRPSLASPHPDRVNRRRCGPYSHTR